MPLDRVVIGEVVCSPRWGGVNAPSISASADKVSVNVQSVSVNADSLTIYRFNKIDSDLWNISKNTEKYLEDLLQALEDFDDELIKLILEAVEEAGYTINKKLYVIISTINF